MENLTDLLILNDSLEGPLVSLPVRGVVVRTSNAGILISPLPKITSFKNKIDDFATVTDILAPNLFHHLGIRPACVLFPTAQLWGTQGIAKKRKNLDWPNILGESFWPYEDEIALFFIEGTPNFNECVFLHRKTKTLIVQDLCFNLQKQHTWGARILFGLFGTYNRFAISRLLKFLMADKAAFRQSVQNLLNQDFENIIMAHGEIVLGNGKELLRKALRERGIKV